MTVEPHSAPESDLIGRVLAPALRLWLRSQLDEIEQLQLVIGGKNRQILTGHIPEVFLKADHAVYQGMHLSHIELKAAQIRINLGQVLKGKSLRLLHPVPVTGVVQLTFADLQASLVAPLLATALKDIVTERVPSEFVPQLQSPQWQQIQLVGSEIQLSGTAHQTPISFGGSLTLANPQTLTIDPLHFSFGSDRHVLEAMQLDLGPEVAFETLDVDCERLQLAGTIMVTPA